MLAVWPGLAAVAVGINIDSSYMGGSRQERMQQACPKEQVFLQNNIGCGRVLYMKPCPMAAA